MEKQKDPENKDTNEESASAIGFERAFFEARARLRFIDNSKASEIKISTITNSVAARVGRAIYKKTSEADQKRKRNRFLGGFH